jgi:hypothetical protein
MWTGIEGLLSRRDFRVFVPEGLNDRSQAIYCLERVQKGDPSRRDGVSRRYPIYSRNGRSTPIGPNHTVPYGTELIFGGYQHPYPVRGCNSDLAQYSITLRGRIRGRER